MNKLRFRITVDVEPLENDVSDLLEWLKKLPRCHCGRLIPPVADDATPFEFCSQECKDAAK